MSLMTESLRRLAEARGGLGPAAPSPAARGESRDEPRAETLQQPPVKTREEPLAEERPISPRPVAPPRGQQATVPSAGLSPRKAPPPKPREPGHSAPQQPHPMAPAVLAEVEQEQEEQQENLEKAAPVPPQVPLAKAPPVDVRPAAPAAGGKPPQPRPATIAELPTAVATLRDAILQDIGRPAGRESEGKVIVIGGIQAEEDAMAAVASLGRAFAGLGGQVLVIDASAPRTGASEELPCDEHGFTSLIDGTRRLRDVIAPTPTAGVHFVRAGLAKGAAQVVDQKAARLTFQDCREAFACTIVNGGDWETRHLPLVARLADAVYLVLRAGATDRDTARRAVKSFDRQGVHIRGCILAGAEARPGRRA